ncbi:MAG: rod shape-determining protein MreC [Gammaproteobacteria bacterium]|nr:MAG: rod shape-determining protein MreC [Gammaproteobacteria bacterium]
MVAEKDNQRRPRIPALNTKLIIFVVLSFILLINDQRNNYLSILRNSIAIAIYPLQSAVEIPSRLTDWFDLRIKSKEILIKENQNLLSQQKINSSILQRYESLEQENERLKQILNAASNLDNKVEITRIISVNVNPYRHTIVIDKGERDGVYEGQVLLDADGVIGQILHTNFLTSEAILISDSDHALPVEINRNGLRTIVLGNGSYTKLDVPYIPNNADIEIGDLLVTSGLGGKFPSGYPVAKVDFIESDLSEQFYKVSAKPIAYLNQVREVMLLQPE